MSSDTALWPSETGPDRRFDTAAVVSLTLLWLIPLYFIGISGNFPLNDDWAYTRAARRLIEIGLIERTSWTWVPAISHSYFGAAASWLSAPPLGVLEAFRGFSVVMGWLGVLGTYALARQVDARPLAAALAAATVGLNPLYLNLSYTYMTDVSFSALCVWSLVFLARGARRDSWAWALAGATVALLAALTRQTGMALPLAFACAVVVSSPIPTRAWGRALVAGALVGFGYFTALEFAYGPEDPSTLFHVGDMALQETYPVFHLLANSLVSVTYMGCFLASVTLLPGARGLFRARWALGLAAAFSAACVGVVVRFDLAMPPGVNVIYDLGLGPHWLDGREAVPVAGPTIWWVLAALGFAAAFVAGARVVLGVGTRILDVWKRPDWLLLLAFPAIFIFPHLFRVPYFDRYLLPTVAPLAVALLVLPRWSGRPGRSAVITASTLIAILGAYATAGTRDYLERQRTVWALLDDLTAEGVSPRRVDGGFEFNGLHSFERQVLEDGVHWKYINDDEFKISHREHIEGYERVASSSFSRVLPPGIETIRLFHRDAPR